MLCIECNVYDAHFAVLPCNGAQSNTTFRSHVQTSYSTSRRKCHHTKCACTQTAFAVSNTLIGILLWLIYMMLLYICNMQCTHIRPTVVHVTKPQTCGTRTRCGKCCAYFGMHRMHTPGTNTAGLRTDGTECAQHLSAVHSRALNPAFDKHAER